jgi:hypothetical protein
MPYYSANGLVMQDGSGRTVDPYGNAADPTYQIPGYMTYGQTADGGTSGTPPSGGGTTLTPGTGGFTNTSTVPRGTPTGIPDPRYPGYDTAGFLLGSTVDAQGNVSIPNQNTGQIATTPRDSLDTTLTDLPDQGPVPFGGPITPFGETFTTPTDPNTEPFRLPTFDELIANSPGYEARFNQGLQARERGAAGRGSLLSGGTLKALNRYGQDYASNEYGNYVKQLAQARGINDVEYQNTVGNALNQFGTRYKTYLDLINNNRNASNDYWQQQMDLINAGLRGAEAAGSAPSSG